MSTAVSTERRMPGLRSRPAAYSVVDQCLAAQAGRHPRSWLARQIGVSPLDPAAKPAFAGALGELKVARILADLGPEWSVFHSVPVGSDGTPVDHLLIGPAGVFTVNTTSIGGHVWVGRTRILVNGRREDFVVKSEREARRVHKRLRDATGASVFVRPILVFVEPHRLTIRDNPASVTVLTEADLVRWLSEQTAVYPTERVNELVKAADQVTTWRRDASPVIDTRRHVQRFERLATDVAEAKRRMRSTKLAFALTFCAVVVASTLAVLPTHLTDLLSALAR